jgi:peroxiredoxin
METKTAIPSYQEAVPALRNMLAEMLPPGSIPVFDADAATMQATFHPVLKRAVGDQAPDFSLLNATGQAIRLSNLLKKSKVVLVFYRGVWCPYCNLQLKQYQEVLVDFESNDAQLVAISSQTQDASLSMTEKNELSFEVLSDNGNMVAQQYTTVFKNAEAPLTKMAELGIDFDSFYTDDSKELPVPAVFIIEKNGIISFAQSEGGDYRRRVEASAILHALQQ